jgi:hypothetical protein
MADKRHEPRAGQGSGRSRKNATVLRETVSVPRMIDKDIWEGGKGSSGEASFANAWQSLPPFEPLPPFSEDEKRLLVQKLRKGLDNDGFDWEAAFFETVDKSVSPPRIIKTNVPAVKLTIAERRYLVELLNPEQKPETAEEKAEAERLRRLELKMRASKERERIAEYVDFLMMPNEDGGRGLKKAAAIDEAAKKFRRSASSVYGMCKEARLEKRRRKQRLRAAGNGAAPNTIK